jgi:NAD(P)-dependent dehydrogenase (short-subunit alcohol dehydrogenase family)
VRVAIAGVTQPPMKRAREGQMGRIEGKAAIISGSASGIGEAVTRRFAAEGARLWLNDINAARLDALVTELRGQGVEVHGTVGDVSDSAFVNDWVDAANATFGRIDILYNNVGVSRHALVGDTSDDDWRFQQRMTLDTVFYATRAVLPHMVRERKGSIVSMSSGAGVAGEYALGAYAAAKAGVINLMETVAMEYGPYGIRANAVTPGPTVTPPMMAWLESQPGGEADHSKDLDLQRFSRPEEVAYAVLFLASDEASNITGIVLRSNIRAGKRPFT